MECVLLSLSLSLYIDTVFWFGCSDPVHEGKVCDVGFSLFTGKICGLNESEHLRDTCYRDGSGGRWLKVMIYRALSVFFLNSDMSLQWW